MLCIVSYLFSFKSSIKYKILYFLSQIIKVFYILLGKGLNSAFFLGKGKFIIENKFGIFEIQEPSDMHAILSICFEKNLVPFFTLENNTVFLDIGANIGKYSIYLAKQGYKTYSFEPNTVTYAYLENNKKLNNLDCLYLCNYGIGLIEEDIALYHPGNNLGVASHTNTWQSHEDVHTTNIHLNSFEQALTKNTLSHTIIGLIKIDVEGSELDIIKSMEPYLSELQARIIIEITQNTEVIMGILKKHGYHLIFQDDVSNYVFDKIIL